MLLLVAGVAVAAPRPAVDANGDVVSPAAVPERILVAGKAALIPSDALFLFPEGRKHLLRLARVDQGMGNLFALLEPELAAASAADTMQNGGTEELAAMRPDLVIAKTSATATVIDKLRPLGIPCFAMSLETPEEWLRELPELGKVLGEEARAEEVCGMIRARMDAVAAGVRGALSAPGAVRPRVLLLQASAADGVMSFSVSPDAWLQTWMVEAAGGEAAWKGTGFTANGWSKVSFEQIAAWNPDAIFFAGFKAPVAPLLAAVKADRRWQLLKAVREGRVRAMPSDLVAYAQPVSRWILCLQWLAAQLWPEAFPGFGMEAEIARFYRDFFGVEPGPVLDAILAAYRAGLPAD